MPSVSSEPLSVRLLMKGDVSDSMATEATSEGERAERERESLVAGLKHGLTRTCAQRISTMCRSLGTWTWFMCSSWRKRSTMRLNVSEFTGFSAVSVGVKFS